MAPEALLNNHSWEAASHKSVRQPQYAVTQKKKAFQNSHVYWLFTKIVQVTEMHFAVLSSSAQCVTNSNLSKWQETTKQEIYQHLHRSGDRTLCRFSPNDWLQREYLGFGALLTEATSASLPEDSEKRFAASVSKLHFRPTLRIECM